MARQMRRCDFDLRVPSRVPKFQTVPEAARDVATTHLEQTNKQRRFADHSDHHRHAITVARIRVKCAATGDAATVRPGERS